MKKLDLIRILQIQELRQEYIKVVQKKREKEIDLSLPDIYFLKKKGKKKLKKKKENESNHFFNL